MYSRIAEFQKEGLIKHVGLSEVSVDEIQAAQKFFTVDTVQNQYNLLNRQSEDVLDYCTENGIGFIPWFPLARSTLASQLTIINSIASKYNATPNQIALAWLLKRSPIILPIPGTSKITHLEENMHAMDITLSAEDFDLLNIGHDGA